MILRGLPAGPTIASDSMPLLHRKYNAVSSLFGVFQKNTIIAQRTLSTSKESIRLADGSLGEHYNDGLVSDVHEGLDQAGDIFNGYDLVRLALAFVLVPLHVAQACLNHRILICAPFKDQPDIKAGEGCQMVADALRRVLPLAELLYMILFSSASFRFSSFRVLMLSEILARLNLIFPLENPSIMPP